MCDPAHCVHSESLKVAHKVSQILISCCNLLSPHPSPPSPKQPWALHIRYGFKVRDVCQGKDRLLLPGSCRVARGRGSQSWAGWANAWARLSAKQCSQAHGLLSAPSCSESRHHVPWWPPWALCMPCSDAPVLGGAWATRPAPEVTAPSDTGAARTPPGETKPCPGLSGGLGNTQRHLKWIISLSSLTQVIRKFAKQLDEWLKVALHDLPENLRNIKFECKY